MGKFSKKLLAHFYHMEHAGNFATGNDTINVEKGSLAQGAVVQFNFKLNGEFISQARFKSYGNAPLLAACEYVCHYLEGKPFGEVDKLTSTDILRALELNSLYNHIPVLILACLKQLKKGRT